MSIAIFSDLHDNLEALYAVLADASRQQVDRFIYLGDVGHDPTLFAELQKRQIPCTYGNWEVSGLRRMSGLQYEWVAQWPGAICEGEAIYAHATPDMPEAAATTGAALRYMQSGIGWSGLFPRLNLNEEARWQAFATLEARDLRVAFHGHTHVQQVWAWETAPSGSRRLRSFSEPDRFSLQRGNPQTPNRYLIGVGSAGQPDDGYEGKYVIYDPARQEITLRRL